MGKLVKDMTKEEQERVNARGREKGKIYRKNNRKKELKRCRIKNWIKRGIVYPDYNDLYHYVYFECTHCEMCKEQFIDKHNKFRRVIDHSHITHEIRGIICHSCNAKLEKQT